MTEIYTELVTWSRNRPLWQRDALRRIVTSGNLTSDDVGELVRMCLEKDGAPAPVPLDAVHVPNAAVGAGTTLVAIEPVQNVARLPSGVKLSFGGAPGLCVVYGANGSGKSSYARILKKACRTRGATPPVVGNIYQESSLPPAANVHFMVSDTPAVHAWSEGSTAHSDLLNVFVFDAASAERYVADDGPTAFRPAGLDVLPKLSKACDAIKVKIEGEIETCQDRCDKRKSQWQALHPGSKVASLMAGLSAKTNTKELGDMAVSAAVAASRIGEIGRALAADPARQATLTRASIQRLRKLEKAVIQHQDMLSGDGVLAVTSAVKDVVIKDAAVRLTDSLISGHPLGGVGDDAWLELWRSARAYSETKAYEGRSFPVTDERCVLCQQELSSEASERLQGFESFVASKAKRESEMARRRVAEFLAAFRALDSLDVLLNECRADMTDLSGLAEVEASVTQLTEHSKQAQAYLDGTQHEEPPPVVTLDGSLAAMITTLDERIRMLEASPELRVKLTAERDDLEDKVWLHASLADVLAQISDMQEQARLSVVLRHTNTKPITDKSNELTKSLVTGSFVAAFSSEIAALGLTTLQVEMHEAGGSKGEVRFGLRLVGAHNPSVGRVASEGERRCVALAAFLAELSQASHRSTLVFDDPVSSLDHWHRERIAERLVQEAGERHVIAFTHDAIFLHELLERAAVHAVVPYIQCLEWSSDGPGHPVDALPWDKRGVKERFDGLEKDQRAVSRDWTPQPDERLRASMRSAYSSLRATIEKVVEQDFFCGVVLRFRSYVDLKRLVECTFVDAQDCERLDILFKKCCGITDAHDVPNGKMATLPTPIELLTDINELKSIREGVIARRKQPRAQQSVQ